MTVRCSICLSPKRADVDTALLKAEPTTKVAEKFGLSQSAVSRHQLKHVRPQVQSIAKAIAPVIMPPPSPVDIIPSMQSMLAKLGETVSRAETLVRDAEREGGIAGRAVSLNALKGALVDTAKLLAVLGPPPPAPAADQIDRQAVRDALGSIATGDQDHMLDRLLA